MDSQTQNELSKVNYVASLFTPIMPMQIITIILNLLVIVLTWLSITVEVFIRHTFGNRYLSPLRLLLAGMTFQTFNFFYWLIVNLFNFNLGQPMSWLSGLPDFGSIFSGGINTFLYFLFIYGFLGASAIHLIAIRKREYEGKEWHTMSFGVSLLEYLPWSIWHMLVDKVFALTAYLWNRLVRAIPVPQVRNLLEEVFGRIPFFLVKDFLIVDDWKLYRFVEPLLCYLAALAVRETDGLLGNWLLIASFALFVKNNMIYFDLRGRALDMMDAQIESHYLQAALSQEDKRKTAGFTVVPVPMNFSTESMNIAATVQETLKAKADNENFALAVQQEAQATL